MTRRNYAILLTVLFVAPLAGLSGMAGQWVTTLLETLGIGLLLLCLFNGSGERSNWRPVPGLIPLAALGGFVLLQALPLPPFLLRIFSGQTWSIYADTVWVARPGVWLPLSFSTKATLSEFFRLFAFAAVYVAAFQLLADHERLKKTSSLLSAYAGVISLVAIGVFVYPGRDPFWMSWGGATVVQDHFAGLLAMAFPIVLAQYLASRPHVSHLSLREKTIHFLRQISSRPHILFGLSCLCVVVAILLSRSWSGILASLCALLVFSFILLTRKRGRQKEVWGTLLLLGVLLLFGLAVTAGFGSDPADTGTSSALSAEEKQLVSRDSVEIFSDFPLFGTGAGTFAQIYPRYKSIPGDDLLIGHVYNDLLEILIEMGLVGTLLFACFLISVLYRGYVAWRQRHSRTSVYLYLGCVSGIAAILLHGWDGYTLHLFAAGLFFSFFCALAVAAAVTSSHRANPEPAPVSPVVLNRFILLTVIVFLLNLVPDVGRLVAEARYADLLSSPAQTEEGAQGAVATAARLDPLSAGYRYALGDAALASGEQSRALNRFGEALRLAPLNAEYVQRLGLILGNFGYDERAQKLLRAGVENDRSNPERHKTFAFWLLSKGQKEEALKHVRQAIFWGPQKTWDYLSLMDLNGLTREEMRRTLPESSIPLLAFGDYLASIGQDASAENSYRAAVRHAMNEKRPRTETFQRAAEFFAERGRHADALEIILMGTRLFPKDPGLRLTAGNLYERLGIVYRAVQEYRGVLASDPDNEQARERLKVLSGDLL